MFRRHNDNVAIVGAPGVKNRLRKSQASSSAGGSRSSNLRIVGRDDLSSEMTDLIEVQLSREEKFKGEILREITGMKEEILARIASDEQASNTLEAGFFKDITEKALCTIEQKLSKQDRISSTILEFLKEQNTLIRNWIESQECASDEATSVDAITEPGEIQKGTQLACYHLAAADRDTVKRKGRKNCDRVDRLQGDVFPDHACIHFSTFDGDLFSEDAEWWLNRMELYFEQYNKTEQQKIAFAVLHLVDTALMWWLDHKNKVVNGERDAVVTWSEFRKLFVETFFLENFQLDLRRRFYGLEQRASVQEYSSKFWKISVRLKGFPEKEKLFKYIYGLKVGLQEEVLERHPSTLAEAVYLAKSLEAAQLSSDSTTTTKTGWSGLLHGRSLKNREP